MWQNFQYAFVCLIVWLTCYNWEQISWNNRFTVPAEQRQFLHVAINVEWKKKANLFCVPEEMEIVPIWKQTEENSERGNSMRVLHVFPSCGNSVLSPNALAINPLNSRFLWCSIAIYAMLYILYTSYKPCNSNIIIYVWRWPLGIVANNLDIPLQASNVTPTF